MDLLFFDMTIKDMSFLDTYSWGIKGFDTP